MHGWSEGTGSPQSVSQCGVYKTALARALEQGLLLPSPPLLPLPFPPQCLTILLFQEFGALLGSAGQGIGQSLGKQGLSLVQRRLGRLPAWHTRAVPAHEALLPNLQ